MSLVFNTKAKQFIVRLDTHGPGQRQGEFRAGIEALAVTDAETRSNAGPLKDPEHLRVRKEPQTPPDLESDDE